MASLIVNLQIIDYLSTRALNGSQKTDMYAELASLSESGWNYSTRWVATGGSTTGWNVRNIIGPDLNSIICGSSLNDARFELRLYILLQTRTILRW